MPLAQARDASFYASDTQEPRRAPRPKKRKRVDPAILLSVAAIVVLIAALGYVAQRARLAALAYELHAATSRLDELKRTNRHLQLQVEEARSLSRVEADARMRLGMEQPTSTAWVVLDAREPDGDDASLSDVGAQSEASWGAAFFEWYDRVRSTVRAALPLHLREPIQ